MQKTVEQIHCFLQQTGFSLKLHGEKQKNLTFRRKTPFPIRVRTVESLYSKVSVIPNLRSPQILRLEIIEMQKWQESRNYRRVKDENGNVVANIITVDGVDVEVTEEVFLAYSQMDRRERYLDEQQEEHPQVSLELLTAHDVPIDLYATQHEISAEESAIQREECAEATVHKERLALALSSLSAEERELIQALFFDGESVREYAKRLGVYHRTIIYRRDKLLEKLYKKIFS